MRLNQLGAELLLLRRLFLGRRVLPSLALPFTIGLVFTAALLVANAFALTGDQIADRELGRFDAGVTVDVQPGDVTEKSVIEIGNALEGRGVDRLSLGFISNDVRPDQFAASRSGGPQRVLSFVQLSGPATDFPDRYSLVSGRWPRGAGEVVLTPALRNSVNGSGLTAFSGLMSMRVVGVARDAFDTDATGMIAAPGTWESIPEEASKAFAPEGALRLLWSGSADAEEVYSATQATLALAPPPGGNRPATMRSDLIATTEQSLSDRQRLLFAYPLSLLSMMAGVALVRSNRRWTRAYARRCRDLGLSGRRVGAVLAVVQAAGSLLACVLGLAVGAVLGLGARALVLPAILTQPAGPVRSLNAIIVAAGTLCLIVLVSSLAEHVGTRSGLLRRVELIRQQMPWSLLRRVVAVLAVLRGFQAAPRSGIAFDDLGGSGVMIIGAAVLLAPELLSVAGLVLPRANARSMMARRMIAADRGGLALVAMIVAASLAFPIAMSTYNASVRRSNDAGFVSVVRPNQIWVDGTSPSLGKPRPVAEVVSSTLPSATRVDLRFASAFVYPVGGKPVETTSIATVRRASDLTVLLGQEGWVEDMSTYVAQGGVGFVDGPARPIKSRDPSTQGDIDVPGKAFGPTSSPFAAPFAGVMLAETAEKWGLSSSPLGTVFIGVDGESIDAAVDAVRSAGLDIRLLDLPAPTPKTKATPESYLALAGLVMVAAFMLLGLMRAVGERMRVRAAQLLAVGFLKRWSASVAALQLGLAVFSGMVAGAIGALVSVWVFVTAPAQAMLLSVPVDFTIWTCVLVAAIGVLGTLSCVARVGVRAEADF